MPRLRSKLRPRPSPRPTCIPLHARRSKLRPRSSPRSTCISLHARGYISCKGLNIFVARMGCTPFKDRLEGGLNAAVSLPIPVDDFRQAERKEEPSNHGDGFYKFRKDQDDQVEDSSSGWSKVSNLLSSFKTNHGNSKKSSSNDNLPEKEDNKVSHRKYVDRSLRFHSVKVKDIEQLVEGKAEPRGNIGGIEDILQLHEAGELAKYLEGFPRHTGSIRPCHGCGDSRFVPYLNCDGSRNIFTQKLGGQGHGRIVWMKCPCCNENNIIRCPVCCVDAAFVFPVCSSDSASVKT